MSNPSSAKPGQQPIVLREDKDGIARLTLNRPAARNALSTTMMSELYEQLQSIDADASVRVIVIAANGPAFCAGHDLKEIRANPGQQHYETLMAQCCDLMLSMVRLSKPVIAEVHATATAAGAQLVATCDLAYASADARFATPGVNIGLFCSTPMVAVSRNVPRKHTMEMLLTGEAIDAQTAQSYGLVNRVVAPAELRATVAELASSIVSKSPLTLAIGKEAYYRQLEMGISDAYAFASKVMVTNMLARDAEEGIDAFIEKREPHWEGR